MVAAKAPPPPPPGAAGAGSLAMESGVDLRAEEYAQDGSVDLRGNPVLRSERGGRKACSFIVGACVVFCIVVVSISCSSS
jgi:hypothetical protein